MMAFKLLAMAEERWRKVNGSELLPLVPVGTLRVSNVSAFPDFTVNIASANSALTLGSTILISGQAKA